MWWPPAVRGQHLFVMQAPPHAETQHSRAPPDDPHAAEELAAQRQALGFLGYLDQGRYADSYAYTGMLIRAQLDRDAFAAKFRKHAPGPAPCSRASSSMPATPRPCRGLRRVSTWSSTTTPALPTGQMAVETLTLAFAKGYWRVSGYYIK